MKRPILILIFFLILIVEVASAATVKVPTRNFTSEPTQRRRTTLTLLSTGPLVSGPWLVAGDSVSSFTDTNGIAYYSNVLAANYRLDIAGTPGRSFPLAIFDTNGVINAADVVNSTNANASYYTAAQVDALLTAAGNLTTNIVQQLTVASSTNAQNATNLMLGGYIGNHLVVRGGPVDTNLAFVGEAASTNLLIYWTDGGGIYAPRFVGDGALLSNVVAATATAASLVTGNGSITSTNFTGNGNLLSNLYYELTSTYSGDASNAMSYVALNSSNTPAQLLTRPAQISGGAEGAISFTQIKRGQSPRGVSTWNIFGANTNSYTGATVTNLINRMVTNGMVRSGCNWVMLDEGYSFNCNGTPGATIPPQVAFGYSFDENRIFRADTNRFPGGLKAIVDYAHLNGLKVLLYGTPTVAGPAGFWMPFGSNRVDMALNVSNLINHVGIDGFKFEGGLDGMAQSFVNEVAQWGKPIWVNVPASNDKYEPWMADAVNSWRPGVGIYGDINGRADRLYQWADVANFSMIRPGHVVNFDLLSTHPAYWGIDVPQIKYVGAKYTGDLNIFAMMTMANSEIWHGRMETYEGYGARYGSYYDDYNNPLANSIQGDFTKPMWKQSSNFLAVTYGKWLEDKSVAVLVQNRSDTNKTEVINFADYFGGYHYTMTLSSNPIVCTVKDIMRNVTLGVYSNRYSATISPTNIAWITISKGIVDQYAPGTNYLSDYGWLYATNYPDNDPGIGVNYFYQPMTNSSKLYIGSTTYDKGFFAPVGGDFEVKYPLHKQADYFTVSFLNRNYAGGALFIYTNDVLAFTTGPLTSNGSTNVFVGVTNADWITIKATNGNNTAASYVFGNPLIYCQSQKKLDDLGRPIQLFANPLTYLVGSGVAITNVGEAFLDFNSFALENATLLTGAAGGPASLYLFNGVSVAGNTTGRFTIPLPWWVTNVMLTSIVQSSGISTWTNLIEPIMFTIPGGRIYNTGGVNNSNEVVTISAANAFSNWTTTVTFPATNVAKVVRVSFNSASNPSATRYAGPSIKAIYR